jgi:50S ribosomal protein L16 3-hydroxylase
LLVQEADRLVPALATLLEQFRFVPNWRLDDVMVSYATDGGGVGPHVDRYGVFLIQAAGCRQWRIGSEPLVEVYLQPGIEHPVLAEFEPDHEWLLRAGDMLYLPPGVAHDGVALGECVTYSVGFRVPDPRELCAGFLRQLAPAAFEESRYTDPGLSPPQQLGEIPADARRRLRDAAQGLFERPGEFDRWIGRFVTRPLRGPVLGGDAAIIDTTECLSRLLRRGAVLRRSAPSHFAWYRDDDERVWLFVGGEEYPLGCEHGAAAELLCGRMTLDGSTLRPHLADEGFVGVLLDLILRGFLRPGT